MQRSNKFDIFRGIPDIRTIKLMNTLHMRVWKFIA